MKKAVSLAAVIAATAISAPAHAAYFIDFLQVGANVVSTGSGSINLGGLSYSNNSIEQSGGIVPFSARWVALQSSGSSIYRGAASGPSAFGIDGVTLADSSSGLNFAVAANTSDILFALPTNYISGTSLGTTTLTFDNATFASLGLAEGSSYTWNFGQAGTADSLTISVGNAQAAVPEPATWLTMILGFGAIGFGMRRRQRQTVRYNFA